MSQIQRGSVMIAPGTYVQTLTGNNLLAVGSNAAGNIDLTGNSPIVVTGFPGINTLTISTNGTLATTYTTDAGNATPALSTLNVVGGSNISTTGAGSTITTRVSGTTNNAVQIGNVTNSLTSVAVGLTGQVLTGVTGGAPVFAAPATAGTVTSVTGGNNVTITGVATINPIVNVSGTTNNAVQIGNVTNSLTSVAVGLTGQVLTGVTGGAPVFAAPAAASISITGDTGPTLVGNAFIFNANATAGKTVVFTGSVSTQSLRVTDLSANTLIGLSAGATLLGGSNNTSLGFESLNTVQVNNCTAIGYRALYNTSGNGNGQSTAVGFRAMGIANMTGTPNQAFGANSLSNCTSGTYNDSFGFDSMASGTVTGSFNVGFGSRTLQNLTSAANCSAIGYLSMSQQVVTGNNNSSLGFQSLQSLSSGAQNTCIGAESMSLAIVTGSWNSVVGYNCLSGITSGQYNCVLGGSTAINYTGAESSNIVIGYNVGGTTGESNKLRIGSGTGAGANQLNGAFISGIDGINVGSVAKVVTMAADQLGTATLTAGAGVSVTAGANTITIAATGSTAFVWSVITADQTAAIDNGYICNKAGILALALPAASAVGSIIEITGVNTANGWRTTQAAGQQIFFGTASTTLGVAGTLTSSAIRDAIRMVCITANTTWQVISVIGNITIV